MFLFVFVHSATPHVTPLYSTALPSTARLLPPLPVTRRRSRCHPSTCSLPSTQPPPWTTPGTVPSTTEWSTARPLNLSPARTPRPLLPSPRRNERSSVWRTPRPRGTTASLVAAPSAVSAWMRPRASPPPPSPPRPPRPPRSFVHRSVSHPRCMRMPWTRRLWFLPSWPPLWIPFPVRSSPKPRCLS